MPLNQTSSPAEKVHLFRTLFRGRQDVWPRRFENTRSGRAGYAPVCGNEWIRGICEKPRIKCGDCPHQRWLPVTDTVIGHHLSGVDDQGRPLVVGVYPMQLDDTCFFLVLDFDKGEWAEDAQAFLAACRQSGVPASLERSRSGNGGHIWIFFCEAIPASLARSLGAHLLTETMESRPEAGLESYDRFFPNQDTLPRGGFGSLIALPLQKAAREHGNTLFLNDQLIPHADQWAYLASLQRMTRHQVETIVHQARSRGRIVGVQFVEPDDEDSTAQPWQSSPSRCLGGLPGGPMPKGIEVVLADQIYIPKFDLPPSLRNAIIRLAAFQNPEFFKAQVLRLPVHGKPRIIACAENLAHHIALPRGCLEHLRNLARSLKIKLTVRDERFSGRPIEARFVGTLTPEQQTAGAAMLAHDFGVLAAATAFGKTVVAAWIIANRGVNTLVLVHREQLMHQWIDRLGQFLDINRADIGRWGAGRKKPSGLIDVALIQSLVRGHVIQDLIGDYGHLIVDECHHLPAHSFASVARRSKARYVTGLSATVARKDGRHPIVFMQCGPVRHRIDSRSQAWSRPFTHEVVVRPTGFLPGNRPSDDSRLEFHQLCQRIIDSPHRNALIVQDVVAAVADGRSPLVLTERTDHVEILASSLRSAGIPHVFALHGRMRKKALLETLQILETASPETTRIVVATGRLIGEGFDHPQLDSLFLTLPVSWHGTIAQYAGRLHRKHQGKTVVRIHDYVDLDVPMLARMFDKRCQAYSSLGYTILLPASALAGWPQAVTLPADPGWKNQYAASIRRLARDGVDAPLANLFLQAASPPVPSSDSADHPRSASEAFIFHRFESLPALQGKFRLNARIPIPFDDRSEMEIDLLCQPMKIAVEIDGPHHLNDPVAYRRDRRKDLLLQSHGYIVLRFLAQDLGQRLDHVLDTVSQTLAARQNERES